MNYYTAKAECDRLNRNIIQIDVHQASNVNVTDFCAGSSGSFLFFGGSAELRGAFAGEKILAEARKCERPIVALTSNDALCSRILRAGGSREANVIITSPRFRNYEFFWGWDPNRIVEFFDRNAIGEKRPGLYAEAFLKILRATGQPLMLMRMLQLARHTDAEIAQIGRNVHASPHAVNLILNYAEEGNLFRKDLKRFFSGVQGLVPARGRGYSLSSSHLEAGFIYLIDIRSPNSTMCCRYFAEELQHIVENDPRILIVCADVNLNQDNLLLDKLVEAQIFGAQIGVSIANAEAVCNRKPRFSAMALLMDVGVDNQQLETELARFGSGQYFFPKFIGHSMLRWRLADSWEVGSVLKRNWVPVSSARACRAVLAGDRGNRVTLANNLVFDR